VRRIQAVPQHVASTLSKPESEMSVANKWNQREHTLWLHHSWEQMVELVGQGCAMQKPYLCRPQAGCIVRGGIFNYCLFLGWLFHHFCI
jgi:hypothetical protein